MSRASRSRRLLTAIALGAVLALAFWVYWLDGTVLASSTYDRKRLPG